MMLKKVLLTAIGLIVVVSSLFAVFEHAQAQSVPSCWIDYRVPIVANENGVTVHIKGSGTPGPNWRITRSLPWEVVYEDVLTNGELDQNIDLLWDVSYTLQIQTPTGWYSAPGCGFRYTLFPVELLAGHAYTTVGEELVVPVKYRNYSNLTLFSYGMRADYDHTKMEWIGAESADGDWQVEPNTDTPGSIVLIGNHTAGFSGYGGDFMLLRFRAIRSGSSEVSLTGVDPDTDVSLNGGRLPVETRNGSAVIQSVPFSGQVMYWKENTPLPGAQITLSNGTDVLTRTTDTEGRYSAELPTVGKWTISNVAREASAVDLGAIRAFDAALGMQYVAGNITLNQFQLLAANADGVDPVNDYDPNRLLRFVVGYKDSDCVCGQWRFELVSTINVTSAGIQGHVTTAYLMCEVSGNLASIYGASSAAVDVNVQPTVKIVSNNPLVLEVSADTPFSAIEMDFDREISSASASGFQSVKPVDGSIKLAGQVPTDSINITIEPSSASDQLIIESIQIDEHPPVIGLPPISLGDNGDITVQTHLPVVQR